MCNMRTYMDGWLTGCGNRTRNKNTNFANERKKNGVCIRFSILQAETCQVILYFYIRGNLLISHVTWHDTHTLTALHSSSYNVFLCKNSSRLYCRIRCHSTKEKKGKAYRYMSKTSIGCTAQVTCCLKATKFGFLATSTHRISGRPAKVIHFQSGQLAINQHCCHVSDGIANE